MRLNECCMSAMVNEPFSGFLLLGKRMERVQHVRHYLVLFMIIILGMY